ncbi:hypothetical protein [Lewinella sp. 4G2]|uniref:tetratricopeptide repeat protein n=1 Tax=Lewinella sp. 4G2 TaxID=1803372 RepID=UPI0012FB77B2|nr:hypothetical protein [Lewinella sp. 4G2]
MTEKGCAQHIPISSQHFYAGLSEPYTGTIKLADQEASGGYERHSVDSILAILDDHLANATVIERLRVCQLAVYGQLLIQSGRLADAYPYCKMANDLAVENLVEDDLIRGYAQAGYGMYLEFYQTPELALEPLQQSLVALNQLDPGSTFPYQKVYNATLRTAIKLGQLANAKRYHDRNTALLIARGDTIGLAKAVNAYGFFLQMANYHEEAIAAFNEGIDLFQSPQRMDSRLWHVNLLESMAHSLMANGQVEAGLANLDEAYYTRKEYDRYAWAMQAMGYIVQYLVDTGQDEGAFRFFRKEQAYFSQGEGPDFRTCFLYQHLGGLLTRLGYPVEAEEYSRAYNAFAANNLLPKAEAQLQEPKALSEHILLQKRAQEQSAIINQLEIEQLRREVRLRQFGLALLGLLLAVTVLSAVAYRWNRRRNERERQRADDDRRRILELENENLKYSVATRERDIKRLAADNRLRTKLKREILQRIETINRLPVGERETQFGKLRSELSTTIEDQEMISKLQDQVETINAEFEDRLRDKIPGITAQEIRYCSLLRLGINNQSIAQLLNKSDATTRSYKYRITKKAGLGGRNALQILVDSL